MLRQFNTNILLVKQCREMIQKAGIVLPNPVCYRYKSHGFMGNRGTYTVGDCLICTDGHYRDDSDDSHYSLKAYKGHDAYWHLLADENNRVWFSATGVFHAKMDSQGRSIFNLTDLEETPFVLEV